MIIDSIDSWCKLLYLIFSSMFRPHPSSTLFPYTTLFRSYAGTGVVMVGPKMRPMGQSLPTVQFNPDTGAAPWNLDRKSTRLNSSHTVISYAVFCSKKKNHLYTYNGFNVVLHTKT